MRIPTDITQVAFIDRVIGTTHDGWRRRLLAGCAKHYELVPATDGYIWAYHDIVDISEPSKIFNSIANTTGNMIVDGVSTTRSTTYSFSKVGRHLVKIKPSNDSLQRSMFTNVGTLVELYLPLVYTSGSLSALIAPNLQKIVSLGMTNGFGTYTATYNYLTYLELDGTTGLSATNSNRAYFFAPIIDTLILGQSCAYIGKYFLSGFTNVSTFVIRATTPPSVAAYNDVLSSSCHIYVPYSSDHSILSAYKAASYWSTYANQIYELNQDGSIPTI